MKDPATARTEAALLSGGKTDDEKASEWSTRSMRASSTLLLTGNS